MANDIDITPGSGAKAATDECTIGGVTVHVQRVRGHGAPGGSEGQVEVSNSNTSILAASSTRQSATLVNRQLCAVYLSHTTATTSSFRLDPGDVMEIAGSSAINGITVAAYTATGDNKVHYWTDDD